jgi:hypothetical protein
VDLREMIATIRISGDLALAEPSCFETAPSAPPQHEGFVVCKLLRQAIAFASALMVSGRMFVILSRLTSKQLRALSLAQKAKKR